MEFKMLLLARFGAIFFPHRRNLLSETFMFDQRNKDLNGLVMSSTKEADITPYG